MPVLRNRLILLHLFSDLVCSCAAMLELRAARMELLRPVLLTGKKEANFRKVIQTTMIRDRQHGPVLELNRVQRKRQAVVLNDFSANLSRTVFGQMSAKAAALITQEAQLLPQRVWKVKLVGESVDDCGGGYHDSIAEMLEELQTPGLLPILTPISDGHETGNGQSDHSAMLINPQENSKEVNEGFRFFGEFRFGDYFFTTLIVAGWQHLQVSFLVYRESHQSFGGSSKLVVKTPIETSFYRFEL